MPNHDIVSKTNKANIILYTKYILLKKSKWKSWLEKEKKSKKQISTANSLLSLQSPKSGAVS